MRPPDAIPVPQGRYVAAKRHRDMIFTSGMTPRTSGVLTHQRTIRADVPVAHYRDAVSLACANALHAARTTLLAHEAIEQVLSLTVFMAAEPGFAAHARVADLASDYLHDELGEAGIGTRAAIGVATLPGAALVEIQLVATVAPILSGATNTPVET